MIEAKIEQLIINSPYEEPKYYWKYNQDRRTFDKIEGRRSSGYYVAKRGSKSRDDEGIFIEIPLVNSIRPKVKAWRDSDYPGITRTTRKLLEYWHDRNVRGYPFFFCQVDAIDTLIFLNEAPASIKGVIPILNDGSNFRRICTKLCTGGGKTIVMAMLIAYMTCNKVSYPGDKRFTKNILIVAPNLTVKKRLDVLLTGGERNYYSQFEIVPPEIRSSLNQARIIIHNWQALGFDTEEDILKLKSVDKRGSKSDNAYVSEVLGPMKNARNILVINDEAHHAWRVKPEHKRKGLTREQKDDQNEATVWLTGLDRIDRARGIMTCYDFSATPFVPGRTVNDEDGLFGWIVSDFSLSDGIESGLVKTPRVAVSDNAAGDKSKLSHIYSDESVKADLNTPQPESAELPDFVRNAYMLLGQDYKAVSDQWQKWNRPTPPVMITVANRTETAARVEYAFEHHRIDVPELCEPEGILRIDSRKLEQSKEKDLIREQADTVGQEGKAGAMKRNIISVGMLSEGWDAKTVTHIMGLRAFTSQLLCEQVVGRGLRRTSYDISGKFFTPEYVNVFGIPFAFLPHEDPKTGEILPEPNKTLIRVLPERIEYKISWPNLIRVEHVMRQTLSLNIDDVPELVLNAEGFRLSADIAPVIDGKTDLMNCENIDLEKLYSSSRFQAIIFRTASSVYDTVKASWQKEGTKLGLLGQVIGICEEYLNNHEKLKIYPELFETDIKRRKILLALNMEKVIRHIWGYIRSESTEEVLPVFDEHRRIRSTEEMPSWWTGRENSPINKSHVSHCVYDSDWEHSEAYSLEHNEHVKAWVKNDHLGFMSVTYTEGN